MTDGVRTALIGFAGSLLVAICSGLVTYYGSKADVNQQLQQDRQSHAKDIAAAVHDAIDNLLSGNPDRVRTTVSGLYFLGDGKEERKQIIETAGSSERPEIRSAISYVLSVDHEFGKDIASDADVSKILSSANATASPSPNSTPTAPTAVDKVSSGTRNDALDRSVSRFVGTGWVYIGLGPIGLPIAVDSDLAIKTPGVVHVGDLITFSKASNFRSGPPETFGFAPASGTVNPGDLAVVSDVAAYAFNSRKHAVWVQVHLCNSASSATVPTNATPCPQIRPAN